MTAARHLAQFNIARIKYPLDDPRMADFVDNVARVNALAEQIDGFVWRLQGDNGNAMGLSVYDDPRILPNLTVWENVEALERFVWKTVHSRFYGRRAEWFEHIETPLVLWHVPAGHQARHGGRRRAARSLARTRRRAILLSAGTTSPARIIARRRAAARHAGQRTRGKAELNDQSHHRRTWKSKSRRN